MLLRLVSRRAATSVAGTGCHHCMRAQSYSVGSTLSSNMPTPTAANGRANRPSSQRPARWALRAAMLGVRCVADVDECLAMNERG